MSSALQDLIISILASVISGGGVWLWVRMRGMRALQRKSAFFGIRPTEKCLIVMNHHPKKHDTMSHKDIGTLVEAVRIVHEIGGEATIAPFDEALEPAGIITEFCIGGPDSNERTQIHLDNFLIGVQARRFTDPVDQLAIITRAETFKFENREKEYAILAKFFPKPNSKPVFLVSGQTGFANKGAMYYLAQNYDRLLRKKYGLGPFCLIMRVTSPWTYGYKMVEAAKDITDTAFVKW
jgi:hypothetical protein